MIRVEPGDCREVIKTIQDSSLDACVTDPPYSLVSIQKRFGKPGSAPAQHGTDGLYRRASSGFMGASWDTGEVAHDPAWWAEVYRVLKPGAHLAAFAGTRTYHRMACAIEDAGFEIRDMLSWNYGTGFPKSHDVAKSIDKAARGAPHGGADPTSPNHGLYKTSATEGKRSEADVGQGFGAGPGQFMTVGKPVRRLRPGADQNKSGPWEKLDDRTYQPGIYSPATADAQQWAGWGTALKPALEPIVLARKPLSEPTIAANVLKWGTGALNINACRVAAEGRPLRVGDYKDTENSVYSGRVRGDESFRGGSKAAGDTDLGRWPANLLHDNSEEVLAAFPDSAGQQGDVLGTEPSHTGGEGIYGKFGRVPFNKRSGEASAERRYAAEAGDFAMMPGARRSDGGGSAARFFFSAKAGKEDRWGSKHPTVKPVELIRWLIRLVTPHGGTILDPFAGSGTAAVAALAEGFDAILIEREAQFVADIQERLAFYEGGDRHSAASKMRNTKPKGDMPLFDE